MTVPNLINVSSSVSSRVTTEEGNVDALQTDSGSFSTRVTDLNLNLSGSGTLISGSVLSTGSFGSVHTAGNVGIGTTSPTGKLSIAGASGVGANVYLDNHTADADSSNLIFRKSRNATIGSHGAVTNNDVIGQIYFQGSDGNSFETVSSEPQSAGALA
jgi:hypothetical protein